MGQGGLQGVNPQGTFGILYGQRVWLSVARRLTALNA